MLLLVEVAFERILEVSVIEMWGGEGQPVSYSYTTNPHTMAKRRKNRTHTKGANAEAEEDKGPKSFVIKASLSPASPLLPLTTPL